jgi:hypothetical protein
MFGKLTFPQLKFALFASLLLLASYGLAACGGENTPTVPPTVAPTVIPAPATAPAYLSWTDFTFADEAEKAQQALAGSRPNFAAWATWTESNRWYVLVKGSDLEGLKAKVGKDATVTPVPYIAEAQAAGNTGRYQAYILNLNRETVDIKAGGAKEAARMLFNRAVQQSGITAGLIVFTLGDDKIYTILPAVTTPEKVLPLSTIGKLEMVGTGTKSLDDSAIIATSGSPLLGGLTLPDTTTYPTIADNSDFISFRGVGSNLSGASPALNFELRPSSKIFEYSRANLGKYASLVFDRQVISSGIIGAALKDSGQMPVPRWAGPGGQADMQRFLDFMNANPPQLFEARELNTSANFAFSGSFTH